MTATARVQHHPLTLALCCILLAGCSPQQQAGTPEPAPQMQITAPDDHASIFPNDHALENSISQLNSDSTRSAAAHETLELPNEITSGASVVPSGIPSMSALEFPNPTAREPEESGVPFISSTRRLSQPGNMLLPNSHPAFPSKPRFSERQPEFSGNRRTADHLNTLSAPPALKREPLTSALPADRLPSAPHTPFSIAAPISAVPTNAMPPRAAIRNNTATEPRFPAAHPMEFRTARSTAAENIAAPQMSEMNAGSPSAAVPAVGATPKSDSSEPVAGMPAGTLRTDAGYSKVQVYYATDRQRSHISLAAYQLSGQKNAFMAFGLLSLLCIAYAGFSTLRGRTQAAGISAMLSCLSACMACSLIFLGQTTIEKHGVNYTGDRGQFTHGIAEVSIPDLHERGVVERPSLLRFEVREDQTKHIVLTDAVELLEDDFKQKVSNAVATAPARDLLVFIHGYNVSFEAALLRTAQLAVDLPFEGVPICYSWPSQATLTGYPVDANNADWTVPHLKDFLLDLALETGADSVNVIAHSMGNRAMTAAIRQISQQQTPDDDPLFDRIVMAAPDIDADYFRRDAAPALVQVANHVTLYASSDDQALIASRKVNGYPRAGDSGADIVIAPGIETVDVSGTDLSLLGHSYYGDNETMLRDLYDVVRARLPAPQRTSLIQRTAGSMIYWQLAQRASTINR